MQWMNTLCCVQLQFKAWSPPFLPPSLVGEDVCERVCAWCCSLSHKEHINKSFMLYWVWCTAAAVSLYHPSTRDQHISQILKMDQSPSVCSLFIRSFSQNLWFDVSLLFWCRSFMFKNKMHPFNVCGPKGRQKHTTSPLTWVPWCTPTFTFTSDWWRNEAILSLPQLAEALATWTTWCQARYWPKSKTLLPASSPSTWCEVVILATWAALGIWFARFQLRKISTSFRGSKPNRNGCGRLIWTRRGVLWVGGECAVSQHRSRFLCVHWNACLTSLPCGTATNVKQELMFSSTFIVLSLWFQICGGTAQLKMRHKTKGGIVLHPPQHFCAEPMERGFRKKFHDKRATREVVAESCRGHTPDMHEERAFPACISTNRERWCQCWFRWSLHHVHPAPGSAIERASVLQLWVPLRESHFASSFSQTPNANSKHMSGRVRHSMGVREWRRNLDDNNCYLYM